MYCNEKRSFKSKKKFDSQVSYGFIANSGFTFSKNITEKCFTLPKTVFYTNQLQILTWVSLPGGSKRRISHVPNAMALIQAREKIMGSSPTSSRTPLSPAVAKASGVIPQTTAHTVSKGVKRVAHVPAAVSLFCIFSL